MQALAARMGVSYREAEDMARECAERGLVKHDVPHSVSLREAGRTIATGKR